MNPLRTHLARIHRHRRARAAYSSSAVTTHGTGGSRLTSAQPHHPTPHVLTGLR